MPQGEKIYGRSYREDWIGERKGSCGRSRSVQDDADRLRRLAGDNVRPLMRPAHRQGGSAGWQYAKRSMKAHPGGASAQR